jgi:sulfonate transport system substrate-binding protein
MVTKRFASLASLACIASISLAACSGGASDNPDSATVGAGASATQDVVLHAGQLGQATIVKELLTASGQDEGRNYQVEWAIFDHGPAALEGVPSGAVEVVMMADTPMIFAQAGGVEAVIVGSGKNMADGQGQVELVVRGDSPVQSITDLKGKKVSMSEGTILQYTLIKMLEAAGMSYDDIVPVNLTPNDAMTALEAGEIDAMSNLDPQRARIVENGGRVIANGYGVVADTNIIVAAKAALADPAKEAAIKDFVLRVTKAYQWASANNDEWATRYATLTGLEPNIAKAVVSRVNLRIAPITEETIAAQQEQADTYTTLGLLPEKLDVTAEYDTRFNPAVEALLGGASVAEAAQK